MATLNYAFKELSCKIVYYGCGLCGKTTNLEHIHKSVPGKFRGDLVSLATEQDRTLFFDFLPLDLGEVKGFKTKFQLYTVPGQVYYNATRKLVLRGVDGICFVVDSSRDRLAENLESLENLKQNLAEYGYHLQTSDDDIEGIPWLLQYNKRDLPDAMPLEELEKAINPYKTPTFEAVAFKGTGVKETLKGISTLVIKKLNKDGGGGSSEGLPAKGPAKPAAAAAPAAASSKDDDEYGELREDESESAKSKAATSSAKPVATPAVKASQAPGKASAPAAAAAAPAKAEEPAGLTLNISQVCDARWRGMKTGGGNLTLANLTGGAKDEYQLGGVLSFAGIIKRTLSVRLKLSGSEPKTVEGRETKVHNFHAVGADVPSGLVVRVTDGSPNQLYLSYAGTGGDVAVSPQGKTPID